MTRARAKELLPIITAFAEGKEIESRVAGYSNWETCQSLGCHNEAEYRVKPEPRDFWIVPERCAVYVSRENALLDWTAEKIIHVREVI